MVVDCVDPEALAAFWSRVLGKAVVSVSGPYVWLERDGGPILGFQRVAEPKSGKNRVHVDIGAADPLAASARIEALGGRRLPAHDSGFLVMADPEGNEFCVIPDEPFDVDEEGRTGYAAP